MLSRFAFCGALGLSLVATSARADSEGDAKDLFARGREYRQKGDCTNASPLFRRAYDIHPKGLGSLRNFAECEEQNGHFATARRSWLDLKRALAINTDTKYAGWEADSDAGAQRLAVKVSHLTIEAPPDVSGTAATITINDEPLPGALNGTLLDRDPGAYRIRATWKTDDQQNDKVDLAPGETKRVTLKSQRKEAPAAPSVAASTSSLKPPSPDANRGAPPPAAEDPTREKWMAPVGWTLVGVGGVTLVGSLVTGLMYSSAKSKVEDECVNNRCPEDLRSTASRGKTTAVLAPVFLGIGVVAAGVGVTLLVMHGKSSNVAVGVRGTGMEAKVTF